jgi:hypothetical protein
VQNSEASKMQGIARKRTKMLVYWAHLKHVPKKMTKTKAPPITPIFDKNRKRWRLSIAKKYSISGKRERKFFKTKDWLKLKRND